MEDRLDRLQTVIFALDDAIDALREIGNNDNDVNCLNIIRAEYEAEAAEIENQLDEEAKREQAALEREYWRAVI